MVGQERLALPNFRVSFFADKLMGHHTRSTEFTVGKKKSLLKGLPNEYHNQAKSWSINYA
jgi:hypothetical protein